MFELPRADLDPPCLSRRRFVRACALAGVGATLLAGGRRDATPVASQPASDAPAAPASKAQWAMIIDLAACDGCGLCTEACQETHHTGEQEWLPVFEVPLENGEIRHLPRPCMHCENAPCVAVCPVKATFHDEHGNVLVDQGRCIGCRMCMAACPYGARTFSWSEPGTQQQGDEAQRPEYPVPNVLGTVSKCMFCAHETEGGTPPVCVTSCPMNAIWFGDLSRDLATNGMETRSISLLLESRNAFRLKEELGTRPRVWYLPGHGEDFNKVPPL